MDTAHHLEEHRAALTGHCYRMLGSAAEADDAVQETMVRAWRNLDRFEQRASLRTWLYRIATRVCLDALSEHSRRMRPMETGPVGTVNDTLTQMPGSHWIEPISDALAVPSGRTVSRSPWRSKEYISFSTTSVVSPIWRTKSAVGSSSGVRISP